MLDHKMTWELMFSRVDHPLLITDLLQYETHCHHITRYQKEYGIHIIKIRLVIMN